MADIFDAVADQPKPDVFDQVAATQSPSLTERIGSAIPDGAVPYLAAAKRLLVDPFEALASKGADVGREIGREAISDVNMLTHPAYLNATLPSPYGPKPPIVSPEELAAEEHPVALGVASGVGSLAGSTLADPRNWPFMASSAARPILQRVISGAFGGMMSKSALESARDLYTNWDQYTPEVRSEKITAGGLAALMSAGSLSHAALGGESAGTSDTGILRLRGTGGDIFDKVTTEDSVPSVAPGPGAQTAPALSAVRESGSDIGQLAASLRAAAKEKQPESFLDKISQAASDAAQESKDALANTVDKSRANAIALVDGLKTFGQGLAERYKAAPTDSDWDTALGEFHHAQQYTAANLKEFAEAYKANKFDPAAERAMSLYAEAGGDIGKLRQWAQSTNATFSKAAEYAQNLSDDEKLFAQNARNYFDSKLDQAIQNGALEKGVDDYVHHLVTNADQGAVFRRLQDATNRIQSDASGFLQTNPSFAKARIHDTLFDLVEAGGNPEYRLGNVLAAYDQSFNRSQAARTFVKTLLGATEKDGRPTVAAMSGTGAPIDETISRSWADGSLARAYTPDELKGYSRFVGNPNFRNWAWLEEMSNGGKRYVRGDLLVHPDAMPRLKALLEPSAVRQYSWRIGDWDVRPLVGLMKAQQAIKGTLMDLSLFHPNQLALHALEHRVNPLDLAKINLDDPLQAELSRGGLKVIDFDGAQAFDEGNSSGSLLRYVPGLAQISKGLNKFTFENVHPRLKMTMALDAFKRNLERYSGELTREQIASLTADQANAAFGGLNYAKLGRSRTVQDIARLALLAPDFLEARGRFVGQALRPWGMEQRTALAGGAVAAYTLARMLNYAVSGNARLDDWKHPFSVFYNGKEYRARLVQGDISHALTDPAGFMQVRLSPAVKTTTELLTGRDEYGRTRTATQTLGDAAKNAVPMAFQKRIRNPQDYSLLDSMLQAVGISNAKQMSDGARAARQYVVSTIPPSAQDNENSKRVRELQKQVAAGQIKPIDIYKLESRGDLTPKQVDKIVGFKSTLSDVQRDFEELPMEEALRFWPQYDTSEQEQLRPLLMKKYAGIAHLDRTPAQKVALASAARAALIPQTGKLTLKRTQ